MKLTLHVSGEPVAQPRPKARAMPLYTNGRPVMKNGKQVWTARVYDPGGASEWKAKVASAAKQHLPPSPLEGPITVTATFFLPRPKSHYLTHGLRSNAPTKHEKKSDGDNLIKAVLDSLTDVGMWRDDGQVSDMHVLKRYANKTPGVVIEIESNEQQPDLTLADAAKE